MKKKAAVQKKNASVDNLEKGIELHKESKLFSRLDGYIKVSNRNFMGKDCGAKVSKDGNIWLNRDVNYSPEQWMHIIAHCQLHLAFGHFDAEKMPGYEKLNESGEYRIDCNQNLWNIACDIYVEKFLTDLKYGKAIECDFSSLSCSLSDELKIYDYLVEQHWQESKQGAPNSGDMIGLEAPFVYLNNKKNRSITRFAYALANTVSTVVSDAGKNSEESNYRSPEASEAANWFMTSYPLLGGLAAGFKILEDYEFCVREEIEIAAVDADLGEIYINPAVGLGKEEMKFILAHEYLHAGLQHRERCQGRDPYLWNIACDYVINGWLQDMQIGEMPEEALYDEDLKDLSAEAIYDKIIKDLKKFSRLSTLRGNGKGDIMKKPFTSYGGSKKNGVSLDKFYRNALSQGLEYQKSSGRGYIPAGLIEEIRALAVPPIPWDVELANWFEQCFPELQKKRSYVRPSRRQSSTPEIPRPGYTKDRFLSESRTFGVVVDTSGSMSTKLLGMALGAIASYAAAKEVPFARVVFCDAAAYDAGYLAPEDIAGRVEVKGRGGTVLQPGIDLLEAAKDFPKTGPLLIITDGFIEEKLNIHREHAYLLPKGRWLPFKAKGKIFYFE